jgi:hypothetical protein
LAAARLLLAARGVVPTANALAGAWDEIEHRRRFDALIDGIAGIGKQKR